MQVFQTPANFLQSCLLLVLLLALAHTEISSEVILDLFVAKSFQNMPCTLMIFVKGKFKRTFFTTNRRRVPCLLQIRVTDSVRCVSPSISMREWLRQALLIGCRQSWLAVWVSCRRIFFIHLYSPVLQVHECNAKLHLSSVDEKVFRERHSLKVFETWLLKS